MSWVDGPTKTFEAGAALAQYRIVRLSSGQLQYAGVKGNWHRIEGTVYQADNRYWDTWDTSTIQPSKGYGYAQNKYYVAVNITDKGYQGYTNPTDRSPMTCTGNPAWGQGTCTGYGMTSCGANAHAIVTVLP